MAFRLRDCAVEQSRGERQAERVNPLEAVFQRANDFRYFILPAAGCKLPGCGCCPRMMNDFVHA